MYYLTKHPNNNDLDIWESDSDADTILNWVKLLNKGTNPVYEYHTKSTVNALLLNPMTKLHGTTTTIAHLRKFIIAEAEDVDTLLACAVICAL